MTPRRPFPSASASTQRSAGRSYQRSSGGIGGCLFQEGDDAVWSQPHAARELRAREQVAVGPPDRHVARFGRGVEQEQHGAAPGPAERPRAPTTPAATTQRDTIWSRTAWGGSVPTYHAEPPDGSRRRRTAGEPARSPPANVATASPSSSRRRSPHTSARKSPSVADRTGTPPSGRGQNSSPDPPTRSANGTGNRPSRMWASVSATPENGPRSNTPPRATTPRRVRTPSSS